MLQISSQIESIHGDLSEPGCDISQADRARVTQDVHYVVHSAASIRFDNPIHTDLTLSYVATQTLAELATQVRSQTQAFELPAMLVVHSSMTVHCCSSTRPPCTCACLVRLGAETSQLCR